MWQAGGLQCRRGAHPTHFLTGVFSPLKIPWACLDLPTDSFSYLHLYNVLNFPIGVVRVTSVTPQDEEDLAFYKGYYGDSSDTYFREVSSPLRASPPGAQARTGSPSGSGVRPVMPGVHPLSPLLWSHPTSEDSGFELQVSLCPCSGRLQNHRSSCHFRREG